MSCLELLVSSVGGNADYTFSDRPDDSQETLLGEPPIRLTIAL